jgi:hypothetical protein
MAATCRFVSALEHFLVLLYLLDGNWLLVTGSCCVEGLFGESNLEHDDTSFNLLA